MAGHRTLSGDEEREVSRVSHRELRSRGREHAPLGLVAIARGIRCGGPQLCLGRAKRKGAKREGTRSRPSAGLPQGTRGPRRRTEAVERGQRLRHRLSSSGEEQRKGGVALSGCPCVRHGRDVGGGGTGQVRRSGAFQYRLFHGGESLQRVPSHRTGVAAAVRDRAPVGAQRRLRPADDRNPHRRTQGWSTVDPALRRGTGQVQLPARRGPDETLRIL